MTTVSTNSLSTDDRPDELIDFNLKIHGDDAPHFFRQFIVENPAANDPEYHRFILRDDKIIAGTSLIKHKLNWHGTQITAGEIGLVGTLEEYRGKGHSTTLMEDCLESMRSEKIPLSFLWGIPNYYERFHYYYGYSNHCTAYVSLPKSCAKGWQADNKIRLAAPDDLDAIKNIYLEYNSGCNGCQVRNDDVWKYYFELVMRDKAHDWWVIGNPIRGYALIGGDTPIVKEIGIAGSADDIMLDLVAGLFEKYPDLNKLDFYHHPQMPVGKWLYRNGAQVRSAEDIWRGTWGGMVRIIDLEELLRRMTVTMTGRLADSRFYNFTGRISIGSEIGGAVISITDGTVSVDSADEKPDIHIPASVLTPIVTGYRGFERFRMSVAGISDEVGDLLSVLFPRDTIYMHHMLYIDEEIELKK